jgi:hypothetical protein
VVVIILTVTGCLSVLALTSAATYGIIINSLDWRENHVPGTANLSGPLAALLGSLISALIAGSVGYLTGRRLDKKEANNDNPEQ